MKPISAILLPAWRRLAPLCAASLLPAGIALLLTLMLPVEAFVESVPVLQPISLTSAGRLEALFDSVDYSWPPRRKVPALEITRIPGDIAQLEIRRKKELFLRVLLPLVLVENARLRNERRWLERVMGTGNTDKEVLARLRQMAEDYGLRGTVKDPQTLAARLHEQVDEVPPGLVLAQAANESGWGTSRFSREVNNLFGEWTYNPTQGVLPEQRAEGASHFVRSFGDLRDSVRSYLHNINSGRAYSGLRELRAQLRREGRELDPLLLATGLVLYSARGEDYVAEIRAMIRRDGLNALGRLRLVRLATAG